jgi:hypothetical protein
MDEDRRITAAIPPYDIKPNLANVANLRIYTKLLDKKARALIEVNKFVVTPTDYIQPFQIYENNEYERPLKIPAFITTDSILHTYHLFYDYSMREVESEKLYPILVSLTKAMLSASENDLSSAGDDSVRDAAHRNVAYFAVARKLLGGAAPPPDVADIANKDLELIDAHEAREVSNVMGFKIDFSQFVPRGHYTRSEKLKRYFKAMMWYGLTAFPIPQGKIGTGPTIQSLLLVRNLRTVMVDGQKAIKLWSSIYDPTAFYVGVADDYSRYAQRRSGG